MYFEPPNSHLKITQKTKKGKADKGSFQGTHPPTKSTMFMFFCTAPNHYIVMITSDLMTEVADRQVFLSWTMYILLKAGRVNNMIWSKI